MDSRISLMILLLSLVPSSWQLDVAFTVRLGDDFGPYPDKRIVIWDSAFVNTGNYFDLSKGKFTAPVTGTYFFSLNLHKRNGLAAPYGKVKVDGVTKFAVDECCDEDSYDNGSNSVLLPLLEGQQVWVELWENRVMGGTVIENAENTFTGFLLH